MRRRRHPTEDQLQLFEPPGLDWHSHAPVAWRRRLRIPLTLVALALATAGIVGGSFAAWTTQTNNAGNQVTAGTIAISNSKSGTSVFTASNVVPGDTGSNTVSITNAGTVPMGVRLTQDSITSTGIEASLRLRIYDQTRNWCYYPVSQAGACPGTGGVDGDGYGAWNASLTAAPIAATDGSAQWPAGQSHTFTVSWKLATSSPNSDQGKTGSFRLVWDGTS